MSPDRSMTPPSATAGPLVINQSAAAGAVQLWEEMISSRSDLCEMEFTEQSSTRSRTDGAWGSGDLLLRSPPGCDVRLRRPVTDLQRASEESCDWLTLPVLSDTFEERLTHSGLEPPFVCFSLNQPSASHLLRKSTHF